MYCLKVIKESFYLLNNSIYIDIEKEYIELLNLFKNKNAEYVYPVVAFHSSPWRAMAMPKDGTMQLEVGLRKIMETHGQTFIPEHLPKGYGHGLI